MAEAEDDRERARRVIKAWTIAYQYERRMAERYLAAVTRAEARVAELERERGTLNADLTNVTERKAELEMALAEALREVKLTQEHLDQAELRAETVTTERDEARLAAGGGPTLKGALASLESAGWPCRVEEIGPHLKGLNDRADALTEALIGVRMEGERGSPGSWCWCGHASFTDRDRPHTAECERAKELVAEALA